MWLISCDCLIAIVPQRTWIVLKILIVWNTKLPHTCVYAFVLLFLLGKGSPKPKPRPRPAPRPRTKPDQPSTPEIRKRPSAPSLGVDENQLNKLKENSRTAPMNHPTRTTSPTTKYVEEDLYDEPEMTLRSGTLSNQISQPIPSFLVTQKPSDVSTTRMLPWSSWWGLKTISSSMGLECLCEEK